MHKVFDVAKYILHYCGEMTTMKLQKLCYYAQSWSLAWDGKPLFDEDFQAWANGPVCVELYNAHKGMFVVDKNFFDNNGDIDSFSEDELETLKVVLEAYKDKTPQYLSELTHKENPWKLARIGVPVGERSTKVIEKEAMQEYYGGLSNE